jgi:hypothetical protein
MTGVTETKIYCQAHSASTVRPCCVTENQNESDVDSKSRKGTEALSKIGCVSYKFRVRVQCFEGRTQNLASVCSQIERSSWSELADIHF